MATRSVELYDNLTTFGDNNSYIPFNTYYQDSRLDYIIEATELNRKGVTVNDFIKTLYFQSVVASGKNLVNFRIAMKNTTRDTMDSSVDNYSTFTEVYYNTSYNKPSTVGTWYAFDLTKDFKWDGTSNLMISVSRDDTGYTSGGGMQTRILNSKNLMTGIYHDSTYPFPYDGKVYTPVNNRVLATRFDLSDIGLNGGTGQYLQMDGVDDYLTTPSVTVTKLTMDISVDSTQVSSSFYYYFDLRPTNNTYMYGDVTGSNQGWLGSISNLTIDGTKFYTTGSTAAANIPKGQKTTLEFNFSATLTAPIKFFRKNDNTFSTKGNIYRLRGYNGASLVYDYDMSTGTVNDQTVNGNHATLSGGTWVGGGTVVTPTGTDGSINFDLKQLLYKNSNSVIDIVQRLYQDNSSSVDSKQSIYFDSMINGDSKQEIYSDSLFNLDSRQSFYSDSMTNLDTRQSIYNDNSIKGDTKQLIYQDNSTKFDTKLNIYQDGSILNDMLQEFFSNGIVGSTPFDMRLVLYKDNSTVLDSKQVFYQDKSFLSDLEQMIYKANQYSGDMKLVLYSDSVTKSDLSQSIYSDSLLIVDTQQIIFDIDHQIIGNVHLTGQQSLNVYLIGKQSLNVNLQGKQSLNVFIKGVIQ